jgi:alpha 1,3-glucosidase
MLYCRITVVFPENERWFNLYTLKEIKGINSNPMIISINDSEIGAYIKGGSILPLKSRIRRSSKLGREEPYYLLIALNKEEKASGALYVDDEETYNFEKGRFSFRRFEYRDNELSILNMTDNYQVRNEIEKIVITGISRGPKEIVFTRVNKKGHKKLDFEFDKAEMILTVFRMNLGLEEEWKIKLLYDSS